jgi:hypothetical protein
MTDTVIILDGSDRAPNAITATIHKQNGDVINVRLDYSQILEYGDYISNSESVVTLLDEDTVADGVDDVTATPTLLNVRATTLTGTVFSSTLNLGTSALTVGDSFRVVGYKDNIILQSIYSQSGSFNHATITGSSLSDGANEIVTFNVMPLLLSGGVINTDYLVTVKTVTSMSEVFITQLVVKVSNVNPTITTILSSSIERSIAIDPLDQSGSYNNLDTLQFSVSAIFEDYTTGNVLNAPTWSVFPTTIGTINSSTGLFTFNGVRNTVIVSVTSGSLNASTTLSNVTPP